MARIFLTSSLQGIDPKQLSTHLETLFQQLEDQLNAGADLISLSDNSGKLPSGMRRGDIVFDLSGGELRAGVYNGVSVVYASFGSFVGGITDAQHGNRAGGLLHPTATGTVAGFQSPSDKIKQEHYLGETFTPLPPTVFEYPLDGDWGFHSDTNLGTYSLAKNKSGTIFTVTLT